MNADGSTTETFNNTHGSNTVDAIGHWKQTSGPFPQNYIAYQYDDISVVTTTSANGLDKTAVTTGSNADGSVSNTLTDDTVINADGSTTETKTITFEVEVPGIQKSLHTSANGLSKTVQLSEAGNSTYDYTDSVVTGLDGSKTETVTVLNLNGTLAEKDATTTSANGQTVSLQSALNGSSTFNHFETIATNADGSVTDTVWDTNTSGTTTDQVITTISANGL